jgi:hypothetical protein
MLVEELTVKVRSFANLISYLTAISRPLLLSYFVDTHFIKI